MTGPSQGYRYPGSHPFQDTELDRVLFRGRSAEAQALLHLILSERLVVLFGKSGIGKSSLLNAGVFEHLRSRRFLPLTVRLNDASRTPAEQIMDECRFLAEPADGVWAPVGGAGSPSLWEFFTRFEFWSQDDVLLTPVLVLDQFEELFTTYGEDQRRDFAAQLGNLVRGRAPWRGVQDPAGEPASSCLEGAPCVKVIISIREDYLAELDELTAYLPSILNSRYRLTPLGPEQAREAIEEPARVSDDQIEIPAFRYEPAAIDDIIGFLSEQRTGKGVVATREVEPFQLQLLCKHIESKVVEQQRKDEQAAVVVKAQDLGGPAGMASIMQNFYDTQIRKIRSLLTRRAVRRLFEKQLIHRATRKRVSLPEEVIEDTFKVPKAVLDKLIDLRLLRADPRARSVHYELSHDTLVEPILRSASKRRRRVRGAVAAIAALFVVDTAYAMYHHDAYDLAARGEQQLYLGDYAAAAKDFRAAIAKGDSSSYRYASLGDALFGAKQYAEAFDSYFMAARRDSSLSSKFAVRGYELNELEEYKAAIRYLSEAIKGNPADAVLRNNLGYALNGLGRTEEALPVFLQSLELDSTSVVTNTNMAHALSGIGRHGEAIRYLARALRLDSTDVVANNHMGSALSDLGRYEEAIRYYSRSISLDSTNAVAHNDMGLALGELGRYQEAIQHHSRAVRLDSTLAVVNNNMGDALSDLGRHDEAIQYYARSIRLDSGNATAHGRMGAALNFLERHDEAIRHYSRSIALDSTDAAPRSGLGFTLVRIGRYREALPHLEKAILLRPQFANPFNHRGMARLKLNDRAGAKADFDRSLRLDSSYARVHASLACYHASGGERDEAIRSLERAFELEYDDPAWLRTDSCFDSVRGDPGFERLLQASRRQRR